MPQPITGYGNGTVRQIRHEKMSLITIVCPTSSIRTVSSLTKPTVIEFIFKQMLDLQ